MAPLSTVTSAPLRHDDLSDAEYDRRARAVLAAVEAASDRFLQDEVIDIDTSRTGGLLELAFPNGSKVVLNTQPPLHELWLAAGAGGFHFRTVGERWIDREGRELFDVLSECASAQAGRPLRFAP
jgi:CyaY protein